MAESSHRMPERLLLGRLDRGLGLIRLDGQLFHRSGATHDCSSTSVETLVGQRVFALALGYEDLNDHDELRHDPLFHVLAGKLEAKRSDCALGGRQEHAQPAGAPAEARGREVSQDRLRCAAPGSIVRGHLPRWPQASAEGDLARPRRHRRYDPRRAQKVGSSMATTTAIATCRSTSSAAGSCSAPSCAPPTSTGPPARSTRSLLIVARIHNARFCRRCGSCCAAIRASAARS